MKQVETYTRLVGLCTENGSMFNPANDAITIDALNALLDKAHEKHRMVNDTHHTLMSAINQRNDAMSMLNAKCSRAMHAASVLIPQPGLLEDLRMYVAKIRGYRLGAVHGDAKLTGEGSPDYRKQRGPVPYLSISSKLDHFDRFIKCLNVPAYVPNEPDISFEGLKAFLSDLKAVQAELINSWAAHKMAHHQLKQLVHAENGLYGISKVVKLYVRSVYGTNSTTFRIMSKLKFTKK